MSTRTTSGGIGIGALIAGLILWTLNHSVLWVVVHVLCGWFYVIYACCVYTDELGAAINRAEGKTPWP